MENRNATYRLGKLLYPTFKIKLDSPEPQCCASFSKTISAPRLAITLPQLVPFFVRSPKIDSSTGLVSFRPERRIRPAGENHIQLFLSSGEVLCSGIFSCLVPDGLPVHTLSKSAVPVLVPHP